MPKEQSSSLIKTCDVITKYSIYVLAFLLPVLFLPWTSDALDFNKQALLVLLVFISLFAWMAKVLISGKLSLNLNKIQIAVFILLLMFLGATLFSADRYGSFWGWPRVSAEGFLSILCLALLFFLVSNAFSKNHIVTLLKIFSISGVLTVLFGVFQLFGMYMPFSFAKTPSFNTVGSVGSMGLFAAILLPLLFILEISSKKWLKIVFGAGIAVCLLALIVINYSVVWWVVLLSSVLIVIFGVVKKDLFDLRWLALPMFFMALALFFIIVIVQVPTPQRPVEVFLRQSTGANIAFETIKKEPVFGSGLGTFSFDFSRYRSADLNQGVLWNLTFNGAGSKVLTILATAGVLGLAAFLGLMAVLLFYGIKFFIGKNSEDVLTMGVTIALLGQILAYFLYGSNLTLDFSFFLLASCFTGLTVAEKREFLLSPSSLFALGVTFAGTAIFIFGFGLLVLDGQRYVAEIYFTKGINTFAAGDTAKAIPAMENAVRLNPSCDIYLSQLSQVYLSELNNISNNTNLSQEDKTNATRLLINNSINAAKLATDASPNNSNNWSARGLVYQNLIGTVQDSESWALDSYDHAISLEPANPYYPTQKGIVYMTKASVIDKDDKTKRDEDLDNAKQQFDKAVESKSDYSNALYFLGLTYYKLGQADKAVENFSKVLELNPDNEQIKTILDNLNAGNDPLAGITQEK